MRPVADGEAWSRPQHYLRRKSCKMKKEDFTSRIMTRIAKLAGLGISSTNTARDSLLHATGACASAPTQLLITCAFKEILLRPTPFPLWPKWSSPQSRNLLFACWIGSCFSYKTKVRKPHRKTIATGHWVHIVSSGAAVPGIPSMQMMSFKVLKCIKCLHIVQL